SACRSGLGSAAIMSGAPDCIASPGRAPVVVAGDVIGNACGRKEARMNQARQSLLALLVAVVLPAMAGAQGSIQYDKIEIKTDKVAPNLYMLSGSEGVDPGHPDGAGGRIGVLAGPDGILMVDAQYLQIGDKVLAAIRRIDSGPIRFLVNTHVHGDHTAGNANFAKLGAVIFAREELREGLARTPANAAANSPARDPARLPVVTYGMGDPVRFRM